MLKFKLDASPADPFGPFIAGGADGSLVDRISRALLRRIDAQRCTPGSKLPSVRQLATHCDVSRDTAARVYEALVAQGHVDSRRGSGYYVKASAAADRWLAEQTDTRRAGVARGATVALRQRHLSTDLNGQPGAGHLPVDWQDEQAIGAALRTLRRTPVRALVGHADSHGFLPLRHQFCLMLEERGIRAGTEQLLVTAGAAEALHLVILANVRPPGGHVLVEDPTSPIILERLLAAGQGFLAVPRGADGPDIAVLRDLCEQHRPKYFFCQSVLHNPTSSSLSPHKAFQVLQIAEEFDLTIVDDDSHGGLLPQAGLPHVARLATLDQLRRVIYIGSLTKTLGAGLRTGFIAASVSQVEWLLKWRTATTISSSNLTERMAYGILSQGGYRQHCEQLRARLDERRQALEGRLAVLGIERMGALTPTSGMFVWADLGRDRDAQVIAARLAEQGHFFAPGRLFSIDGDDRSRMRFNVATRADHPAWEALASALDA